MALISFDLNKTPLSQFDSCPRENLPDVMGRVSKVARHNHYIFDVGNNAQITVVQGSDEESLAVSAEAWLQYYSWDRAAHHRHWNIKRVEMTDDKYAPINNILAVQV